MSIDLSTPGFDVDVTLVNGQMTFGFDDPEEVARFLTFVRDNPDHVFPNYTGPFTCAYLKERYIDTDNVREPLGAGEFWAAMRRYGWVE